MTDEVYENKKLEDFAWFRERDELIKKKKERIERGEIELNEDGQPKKYRFACVEEVLKFADASMNQPEIWEIYQSVARRYKVDPETEWISYERTVLNFFRGWYMLKYAPDFYAMPFMAVERLLLKIAHGWIEDDLDNPEIKEFLLKDLQVVMHRHEQGEMV